MATSAQNASAAAHANADYDVPGRRYFQAFRSILEPVVVSEALISAFDGSVSEVLLARYWTWVCRDLITDLERRIGESVEIGKSEKDAVLALIPEVLAATRGTLNSARRNPETDHKLTVQLGGESVRERLPLIIDALKARPMIEKARGFGKAANNINSDKALANALKSLPIRDPSTAAFLMHAVAGQMANPTRLVGACVSMCASPAEKHIWSGGYGPMIEALFAHAQHQVVLISQNMGPFADIDLVCRAVGRFHRLMRAVTGQIELSRGSRWSMLVTEFTSRASSFLEPRLLEIGTDMKRALKKPTRIDEPLDSEAQLAALSGLYLLIAVGDARPSLALNSLYSRLWSETGYAIEVRLGEALNEFRLAPQDRNARERLDAAIQLSEIRYDTDYAEIIRKARDTALRNVSLAS